MNKTNGKHYIYDTEEVTLHVTEYVGGNLALAMYDSEGAMWGTVSVNIMKVPKPMFAVDTNNLPGIDSWLVKNDVAVPTGNKMQSGYCIYPVYMLTDSFINGLREV